MKTKLTQLSAILLAITLLVVSCKKEDTSKAPTIPPYETMVINFGGLANHNKSVQAATDVQSSINWTYSALSVGFWNTLIGATFAVPVAAFKSSFGHLPAKTGDNTWQWTYTVDGFTSQYTARLVGELQTSQIKWEMYVTKTGVDSFDEFLWFEGTSNLDGNSGQWILYQSAEHPDKAVQIDWEKTQDEVGQITYTYVRETDDQGNPLPTNGSYLTYGLQDSAFDAYVNSHYYSNQDSKFYDVNIEWSRTDYSGHVKSEDFFNDTDWHCWDSDGNDVDCSN